MNGLRIQHHSKVFAWRGDLASHTHLGFARNPLCGDEIRIDLLVEKEYISKIRFRGQGCVVSQASGGVAWLKE